MADRHVRAVAQRAEHEAHEAHVLHSTEHSILHYCASTQRFSISSFDQRTALDLRIADTLALKHSRYAEYDCDILYRIGCEIQYSTRMRKYLKRGTHAIAAATNADTRRRPASDNTHGASDKNTRIRTLDYSMLYDS